MWVAHLYRARDGARAGVDALAVGSRAFVDEDVASSALGSEVTFAHRSDTFRYFSATSLCLRVGAPTFTIAVGNRSVAASG